MNESRSQSYKPSYESSFYKKLKENEKEEENPALIKAEKMKQFYDHVKEHFPPDISEKKREYIIGIL